MGITWAVLSLFTLGFDLCHENDVTNNKVDSCNVQYDLKACQVG